MSTVEKIREELKERGTSLQAWALRKGYVPRTVNIVVHRWAHRTDRVPHGGLSRQIMADLHRELEE